MSHKAREIVGKHPSRVQEGCLFFEQIWGCCSTQPRKKLFFATIIRVKGIGGRYVVHMMPALLVHSLVAVAEKRKALCVSYCTLSKINHMIEKLSSPFFLPEKKGLLSCY